MQAPNTPPMPQTPPVPAIKAPGIPDTPNKPREFKAPDLTRHNPDPMYIRYVLRQKGMSITEAARASGIPLSTFNDKLGGKSKFTYCEQYTIESL